MGRYFGTDGIRGAVGQWPLVPEFFLKLGLAVGHSLRKSETPVLLVIGRDTRQSGELLQTALVSGLLSSGIDVFDAGVIPTAGIAWLVRRLKLTGGVVISASHNPVEQNGVKFIDAKGLKFSEALEEHIESLLESELFSSSEVINSRQGRVIDGKSLQEIYIQALLEEHPVNFLSGLKLLVDCSNGAASYIAPQVFSRAGAHVITLHASPDGQNINQHCGSERARRAPWEMGKSIQQYQANFGLAFDGDADRVVFVDETGMLIDGDHILGFLAKYFEKHRQLLAGAVVTTPMRNTGLKTYLESKGLVIYETPVGDKYVVEKLLELRRGSPDDEKFGLGGEQAGHIDIVNELFTTGDGIRTALYVIRAFLESKFPSMSSFAGDVGKTPQIIASAYVGLGARFDRQQLSKIEKKLIEDYPDICRVNLRYSGTEPLFRVMLESHGQQSVQDLARIAWLICRQAQGLAIQLDAPIDILDCTHGGIILPQIDWG